MDKNVLINAGAAEIRVAIVEDGRLQELFLERLMGAKEPAFSPYGADRGGSSLIGSIILGRVQRVLPGMQAAFVDIGDERSGFLGAREARCLAGHADYNGERAPKIGDCVREGEEVLVQVIKDPVGEKGARLSANVTILGRFLVLVPGQSGISLSRRITDEAERARLTELSVSMIKKGGSRLTTGAGYIVRSAAIGASLMDLLEDAERLGDAWGLVKDRRRTVRAPSPLHHDLGAIERTMRDEVDADTSRVLVDDWQAFETARAYCARAVGAALDKVELFSGPGLLFDLYNVEDDIAQLSDPRVQLPSGGWITFEGTEALTAVDVNSGSFTESTGLEETSLRVNIEAAQEIGRQLRLRSIGGLVVVDFIHLCVAENAGKVLDALSISLARDSTPTRISGMSEFGVVEITRKRVREPLVKLWTGCCSSCGGTGRQRTRESVGVEIVRRVERESAAVPGKLIVVKAAPDVMRWFRTHDMEIRAGLARRGVARVEFQEQSGFRREEFDVGAA